MISSWSSSSRSSSPLLDSSSIEFSSRQVKFYFFALSTSAGIQFAFLRFLEPSKKKPFFSFFRVSQEICLQCLLSFSWDKVFCSFSSASYVFSIYLSIYLSYLSFCFSFTGSVIEHFENITSAKNLNLSALQRKEDHSLHFLFYCAALPLFSSFSSEIYHNVNGHQLDSWTEKAPPPSQIFLTFQHCWRIHGTLQKYVCDGENWDGMRSHSQQGTIKERVIVDQLSCTCINGIWEW